MRIEADFSYLQPIPDKPWTYMHEPPAGVVRESAHYDIRRCAVADARLLADTSLDVEGFRLVEQRSAMVDFRDWQAVRETYLRECASLAGALTGARLAIVNLWRPLISPVLDTPLGVCDASSVTASDLVATDIHYQDRSGEIYLVTHSPAHRWHDYPKMTRDEVLVFKSFDSAHDVARFTPHAAFDEPDIPPDAPLRRSIETRVLLVF